MHPEKTYQAVAGLFETGWSDYEIARLTGVPRSTVQKWRHAIPSDRRAVTSLDWNVSDARAYAYVLGLYLGDGHIVVRNKRPRFMRIYLDAAYPQVVREAADAIASVFMPAPVHQYDWGEANRIILQVSHRALLIASPQHGPGTKHTRRIQLVPWQFELTRREPAALIRGLIHSDGCRTINRFKTKLPSGRVAEYEYPRYFFTNLSADIRGIFCEHCELLGIHWTQSNARNISVSHRKSVAILEQIVGPKR